MITTTQTLTQYLTFLPGSREAGLLIAKDASELKKFQQQLDKSGFREVLTVAHLLERLQDGRKNYLVVDAKNAKDVYDTAIQYPTGQVQWFDPEKMTSKVITPNYSAGQILFVITERILLSIEKKGLGLRTVCGITYRN